MTHSRMIFQLVTLCSLLNVLPGFLAASKIIPKGCSDNGEMLPHPDDRCSYVVCSYAATFNGRHGNRLVPVSRRCAPGTSVDSFEFDPYNPCSVPNDYCKPEFEIRYMSKEEDDVKSLLRRDYDSSQPRGKTADVSQERDDHNYKGREKVYSKEKMDHKHDTDDRYKQGIDDKYDKERDKHQDIMHQDRYSMFQDKKDLDEDRNKYLDHDLYKKEDVRPRFNFKKLRYQDKDVQYEERESVIKDKEAYKDKDDNYLDKDDQYQERESVYKDMDDNYLDKDDQYQERESVYKDMDDNYLDKNDQDQERESIYKDKDDKYLDKDDQYQERGSAYRKKEDRYLDKDDQFKDRENAYKGNKDKSKRIYLIKAKDDTRHERDRDRQRYDYADVYHDAAGVYERPAESDSQDTHDAAGVYERPAESDSQDTHYTRNIPHTRRHERRKHRVKYAPPNQEELSHKTHKDIYLPERDRYDRNSKYTSEKEDKQTTHSEEATKKAADIPKERRRYRTRPIYSYNDGEDDHKYVDEVRARNRPPPERDDSHLYRQEREHSPRHFSQHNPHSRNRHSYEKNTQTLNAHK